MKTGKKAVAFLLLAALLFTLLPAVSFADPPDSDPTHQHKWVVQEDTATCTKSGKRVWKCTVCGQTYGEASPAKGHKWDSGKVTKQPSCTETGVKTFTCSRCKKQKTQTVAALGHSPVKVSGKAATCTETGLTDGEKCARCNAILKKQETIAALGHDWDAGVVTVEPHGFQPGVVTHTCRRDASHTSEEELGGIGIVFDWLHGIDFSSVFTRDLPPLVIAEQPQGGYLTRWEDETHTMHVTASGGNGEYTYEWHSATQEVGQQEGINDLLKWFVGLFGVTPEEVDAALEKSLSDTDTLTVSEGNELYYCIVSDSAGNSVTSEKARVGYRIRVAKQPDNGNLIGVPSVTLTCAAADGSGDYTYRWYSSDLVFLGKGDSLPVAAEGDYFCTVEDNATGETVDSELCTVYTGPRLELMKFPADTSLGPDETMALEVQFIGGSYPYEIWWDKDGEAIESEDYQGDGEGGALAEAVGPGVYTFHVADSWREVLTATCTITERHLSVVRQPEGGELPVNGYVVVSAEFSDGEGPFTYYLYCNGKASQVNYNEPSFKVWHPCTCSILAVDGKDRSVMSDSVTVRSLTFRIRSQTEQATLTDSDNYVVLSVEAEGGTQPYIYDWSIGDWSYTQKQYAWRKLDSNVSSCYAFEPGMYRCLVKDADGRFVWSRDIPVDYTGPSPLILKQPKNKVVEKNADGEFDFTLSCKAVRGSSDGWLLYEWYWREWEGDGRWYLVGTTGTESYRTDLPGMYQCRVVDMSNQQYTWSRICAATEKLECTSARPVRHSGEKDWVYQFSFTGGAGPYRVWIHRTYNDNADPFNTTSFDYMVVDTAAEMKRLTLTLPKRTRFWHRDTETYEYEDTQYFLYVEDALGQKCTTPYATWY